MSKMAELYTDDYIARMQLAKENGRLGAIIDIVENGIKQYQNTKDPSYLDQACKVIQDYKNDKLVDTLKKPAIV